MQRKALSLAVAAALSMAAGSAFAVTYSAGDTAVVNISGSSATNGQLKLWAQNVLCSSDQAYFKYDKNNFAVVCTPNAGKVTLTAGKTHIAVVKNSEGGSGQGISPEIAGDALPFINVFAADPTTTRANAIPDFGMSDEEPSVLVAAGAASGDIGVLTSEPLNVVTFGTPVTLGLYHALQDAQIASGKLAGSCKGAAGSNDPFDAQGYSVSEACMPSLGRAQIASIFSGNAADWSEFGLTRPVGSDTSIYVARRVYTSGTQTAARVFFLNDPCAAGVSTFVAADYAQNSSDPAACNFASGNGGFVFEGSGSGNVETCMTNHDRNDRWAISINSLEFPAVAGDTSDEYAIGGGALQVDGSGNALTVANKDHQRHIKIDGVSPSTFNTAVNRYGDWVEATMNYKTGTLSADASNLKTAMVNGFNDPAVLVGLNNGFNTTALWHAAGDTLLDAGIIAPAQAGAPAATANVAATHTTPGMYYTHSISGAPNTCQPAMTYWATGLSN